MAAVAVGRPLPTVLQPPDAHSRTRRRVVSFSSESIPSSDSNPHSGESWFQVPASQSSHSSASSHQPLPKGARPASPQPARVIELDSPSHVHASHHHSTPLKRSGTFSSWKLEWRGVQKVVKWAILGDKSHEAHRRRRKNSQAGQNTRQGDNTDSALQRELRLDDDSPRDRGVSPYICSSPTSPVSPTTSATCVDALLERHYSHSELDHGHSIDFTASEVHFPLEGPPSISTELRRRQRSVQTSGRGFHVQESRYTNVRHAKSELGHGQPYGSSFDVRDTFSNVDQSTTSLESSYNWPGREHAVHSDIGHSTVVEHMPVTGFSSAFSLSFGHDNSYIKPGVDPRPFKHSRSIQSTVLLPVSTTCISTPVTSHRRPRKLRKSLKAMPFSEKRSSQFALSYSSASPETFTVPTSRASANTSFARGPPLPPKAQPRQPRKLKKRPSPTLPPLPRTKSSDIDEDPPPVPPKTGSIPQDRREVPTLAPISHHYTPDSSAESPPALTDASTSTSPDDEFHSSPQDSSVTSEHLSDEAKLSPPVKRPSLLRTESNRRWTVAVADVPEDLLLEELERLRRMGLRAGDIHGVRSVVRAGESYGKEACGETPDRFVREEAKEIRRTSTVNAVYIQQIESEEETDWLYARRAILCCRDLVRTERSYQERLMELVNGNIRDSVPVLLLEYLPAVVRASRVLIAKFNEDMSASGLAAAFLSVQPTLERALVPWCGVVGSFFGQSDVSLHAAKRKRDSIGLGALGETHVAIGAVKAQYLPVHGRDKAFVARSSSARESSGAISASPSAHWLFRPAFAQGIREAPEKESLSLSRKSSRQADSEKNRRRMPSYRDLAILPTQRVTRYTLLYKDLLKHTPSTSPSRTLVERALEAATNLARKCDRAQGNSALLVPH